MKLSTSSPRFLLVTVLLLSLLALACTPICAQADEASLGAIEQAIEEKGLDWQARDYAQDRSYGAILKGRSTGLSQEPLDGYLSSLPASLDWRNVNGQNWVSSVKDQENCGSCWAFAGVGALESRYALANNTPNSFLNLSEQILVSCCTWFYGYFNTGCSGGYMDETARFLRNEGTATESCYTYRAQNGSCGSACANWRDSAYQISGYQSVSQSVNGLKQALQEGPIQVAFLVYADFDYYESGVYEYAWGSEDGGHAVLLVGYTDDAQNRWGGGYFIVKNSWGTNWARMAIFESAIAR